MLHTPLLSFESRGTLSNKYATAGLKTVLHAGSYVCFLHAWLLFRITRLERITQYQKQLESPLKRLLPSGGLAGAKYMKNSRDFSLFPMFRVSVFDVAGVARGPCGVCANGLRVVMTSVRFGFRFCDVRSVRVFRAACVRGTALPLWGSVSFKKSCGRKHKTL